MERQTAGQRRLKGVETFKAFRISGVGGFTVHGRRLKHARLGVYAGETQPMAAGDSPQRRGPKPVPVEECYHAQCPFLFPPAHEPPSGRPFAPACIHHETDEDCPRLSSEKG